MVNWNDSSCKNVASKVFNKKLRPLTWLILFTLITLEYPLKVEAVDVSRFSLHDTLPVLIPIHFVGYSDEVFKQIIMNIRESCSFLPRTHIIIAVAWRSGVLIWSFVQNLVKGAFSISGYSVMFDEMLNAAYHVSKLNGYVSNWYLVFFLWLAFTEVSGVIRKYRYDWIGYSWIMDSAAKPCLSPLKRCSALASSDLQICCSVVGSRGHAEAPWNDFGKHDWRNVRVLMSFHEVCLDGSATKLSPFWCSCLQRVRAAVPVPALVPMV